MSSLAIKPELTSGFRSRETSAGTRLNLLNIGLILVSFVVALFLPFELFLFAYAVLGPGHYLTEISWLQKRRFFTKLRYDGWLLAAVALVPILARLRDVQENQVSNLQAGVVAFGLGCALVFFLTDRVGHRVAGLALVAGVGWVSATRGGFAAMLLAVFVPTLIHVYVFTGFFMLYGALKARSHSGYLAFGLLLACPLLYFVLTPAAGRPSDYVLQSYWRSFSHLNVTVLGIAEPKTQLQMDLSVLQVFGSRGGLILMRFVAFAYTYHYLNWFSKTSIIKWHDVPRPRLAVLGILWAGFIGLYLYDYGVAVRVLFCLSFLHVFLEFPLNHMSILGTFRELPRALSAAKN